jgi:hypothetical protein
MKSNYLYVFIITLAVFICVNYADCSELNSDKKIAVSVEKNIDEIESDVITVIRMLPLDIEKYDNVFLRVLKSKVDVRDATRSLKLIPDLLISDKLSNFDDFGRVSICAIYISFFQDIYCPVSPSVFCDVAKDLKQQSFKNTQSIDSHSLIYSLIHQALKQSGKDKRIDLFDPIIGLMPLKSGRNSLVLSSVFTNCGKEMFFDFIEKAKNAYPSNTEFIEELEESKNRIIKNSERKDDQLKIVDIKIAY